MENPDGVKFQLLLWDLKMGKSSSILKNVTLLLLFALFSSAIMLKERAERPLAYVQKFKPQISVENGSQQIIEKRGRPLFNGDTLRTDENGFALVQFMDKSLVKVKPQSRLVVLGSIEGRMNTSTRIGLKVGEIFLNVAKQSSGNFEVATNTSVASVKGTKFGATASDYFWVQEGIVEVFVNKTGETVTLTENRYGQVRDNGTIETGEISDEEIEKELKDYEEIESELQPEVIKIHFIDENGQPKVIELKVFEN